MYREYIELIIRMNPNKKYLTEYIESLQRKVLYNEPIFLMKVVFKDAKQEKKKG